MSNVTHRDTLVSKKGGTLDFVRDGEVLVSIDIPPGTHSAREYAKLLPEGAEMQASGGLVALRPASRIFVEPYGPGATDSGANPDFQPTSASRLERQMRLTLARPHDSGHGSRGSPRARARINRAHPEGSGRPRGRAGT